MKVFYYSVLAIPLCLVVACANIETKNEPVKLQAIDFIEEGYFLEGARFEVIKQNRGCLLKGTGYGETGQNQYEFYFNHIGLTTANYTSYRYPGSIYDVSSDADMIKVEEVSYGENSEEDESILELFSELIKLITAGNLHKCD